MTDDGLFKVPESNLEALRARVAKLNKRGSKLGCSAIEINIVRVEDECVMVPGLSYEVDGSMEWTGEYRKVYFLAVQGETPKLAGWSFVATLAPQYDEGGTLIGNILRSAPDAGTIPAKYREAGLGCEHCNTNRRRSEVFVLRSESGEYKQVGRQCLRDFLGHTDPETYARMAELLFSAMDLAGDAEFEGFGGIGDGSGFRRFELETFLAEVAAVVRVEGWRSRSTAKSFGGAATVDITLDAFHSRRPEKTYTVEDADKKVAAEVVEWLAGLSCRDLEGENDYLYNLSIIGRQSVIDAKSCGLAASAIAAYLREQEREINRRKLAERHAASTFVGVIGKRQEMKLTLDFSRNVASDFGLCIMYRFVDEAGNVVVWFASNEFRHPQVDGELPKAVALGDTVTVQATPKKHQERDGIKQTTVSRVAFKKAKK